MVAATGTDARIEIEADTLANAKVKAELKGIIRAIGRPSHPRIVPAPRRSDPHSGQIVEGSPRTIYCHFAQHASATLVFLRSDSTTNNAGVRAAISPAHRQMTRSDKSCIQALPDEMNASVATPQSGDARQNTIVTQNPPRA